MTSLPTVPNEPADDYPTISALNTLLFCERRAFLQLVEGVWVENTHTILGSQEHRRVHQVQHEDRETGQVIRGLRLLSHSLKIQGVADLVEFQNGIPYPVEYKRGKRRQWDNDDVQLCAQAICIEEMMNVSIPVGAIFHIRSKRRREVKLTPLLRDKTRQAASRLHEVLALRKSPKPVLHKKCLQCSLHKVCMPEFISQTEHYETTAKTLFEIQD